MKLPEIDFASVLDMEMLTGLFASLFDGARAHASNDTILILITFLYELDLTRGLF